MTFEDLRQRFKHASGRVVSIEQTGDSNQKSLASKTPHLVYANEEYSTATDKTELFLYSMYGTRAATTIGNIKAEKEFVDETQYI